MKPRINPFLALLILSTTVHGAAKTWDVNPGDDGTITAGSGTWLTNGPNWNSGTEDSTWIAGDTATFQADDDLGNHLVTVGGPVTTGQTFTALTFVNSGYTLQAATPQTVTLGTGNTDCSITVAAGQTATIGDNLTVRKGGTAGVCGLFGGGTLNLGSGNPNGGAVLQFSGTGTSFEMRNGSQARPGDRSPA